MESSRAKLLWMNQSLEEAWKADHSKDFTWLLGAASTVGQLAVSQFAPSLVPKGLLAKAAKSFSGKAAGELVPSGHGIFETEALQLSHAEKQKLENEKELFKAVGEGTFLVVWATLGSTAPVLGGIVLIAAGLKYLVKQRRTASQERWEEITASMMDKYKEILDKAEAKKMTALQRSEEVAKIRLQYDFNVERKQDAAPVVGTAFNAGDRVRLFIYFDYCLNLNVDLNEFTPEVLAKVYASIQNDVEAYSRDSSRFDNNPQYLKKQSVDVAAMLANVD